jgi:hypothetical protein
MSSPSPIKRLRALAAQIPDDHITRDFMEGLGESGSSLTDRSISIIGAAIVEKALEVSLLARLTPLKPAERDALFNYDKNGPLSDFSARTKMAFALGIVGPKTRDDLEHIRHIRNAFAHSIVHIDFTTDEISTICAQLNIYNTLTFLTGWKSNPRHLYT